MNQLSQPALRRRARRNGSGVSRWFIGLCVSASFAAVFSEVGGEKPLIQIGSGNFGTPEMMLIFLGGSIIRYFQPSRIRISLPLIASLALLASFMVALARGLPADASKALFTARMWLGTPLLAVLGALIANKPLELRHVARTIKVTSMIFAALCVSRLLFHFPSNDNFAFDGRPLAASSTLITGIAAVLFVSEGIRLRQGNRPFYAGLALLLICLATRQGTANIATLAALAVVFFFERGRATQERWLIAGAGALLAILAFFSLAMIFSHLESNQDIADWVQQRGATNETRQIVWSSFLDAFWKRGPVDMVFGLPLGQYEDIFVQMWGGTYWHNALHSMYYETLQAFGFAGLVSYVTILLTVLFVIISTRKSALTLSLPISRAACVAILVEISLFGYSYDLRGGASIFLLVVTAVASTYAAGRATRGVRPTRAAPRLQPYHG